MSGSETMYVGSHKRGQKSWFIFGLSVIGHILNNQSIKLTSTAALSSRIGTKKAKK